MFSKIWHHYQRYQYFFLLTGMVTMGVVGLSLLSVFQPFELFLLDTFLRVRPHETSDSRIIIITLDESDLRQLAQWPISDAVMAQLLANIRNQDPRVIALDIYRDFPVEPGHDELQDIFSSTPNLIGIEQVGNIPVAPPPQLESRDQVAFSNLLLDDDGKVRRALLSVDQDGTVKFSLGTFAALEYLEQENIVPQSDPENLERIRLGDALFTSLKPFSGGYGYFDSHGYQIMLNYRKPAQSFITFSIIDAIENRIPSSLLRDRIVFIGVTAPSLNDMFFTPYAMSNLATSPKTAGVEIHAQITSQILSTVLDNRPSLKGIPNILDHFLVIGFTLLGFGVVALYVSPHQNSQGSVIINIVISIFLIGSTAIGVGYVAFLLGWWIPIVTPLIALLVTTGLSAAWHNQVLHQLAYIDGLTKISNRRCFDHYLSTKVSSKQKFSLILCDVDYFKYFNDTYGHQAGDECLMKVANAMRQATRPSDFVARYGGEEFAIILPNADLSIALQIADRIRTKVAELQIPHQASDVSDFVSLSCGVAVMPHSDIHTSKECIECADKALYSAKLQGRNRVGTPEDI